MPKVIMIQGTMSGAGKSLIAGALCRIFTQDGYKTAPFKSQNMALNSFVTSDGFEMGRAQVMQAEAAMREPDVRMNPILLKPTSDVGSQVIVNGKPIGNMTAKEYFSKKTELIPHIMEAYNSLLEENDIIVIEGAGSPAEINLKTNDIVNMGMARLAKSPVLLVGDIDRGGVFAQLYGTIALLEKREREITKGLIINKFRGDVSILQSGLDMLYELTEKPVLGVIPYTNADIDDEDSLTERFEQRDIKNGIDITVIRLPRISNFTDFTPFECIPGVSIRYVSRPRELGEPDMIILPGTKNTMGDLKWLRESGLEAAICRKAGSGVPVMGICGGYQMLGRIIADPENTEGGGSIRGMGLLDTETVFKSGKTTTRVSGRIIATGGIFSALNGIRIDGYEIHMGCTASKGEPLAEITDNNGNIKPDGLCSGNVYGTYVHGIFDNEEAVKVIVEALMERRGIDYSDIDSFDMRLYKQRQYDILADTVRNSLDMKTIYDITEQGI
ncbi:MAG: cobyric acid synthase [Clostridiales bacterium]|nr:cobyric acid synthase [Clostridiales bacterium]